jgi:hypothetical protein
VLRVAVHEHRHGVEGFSVRKSIHADSLTDRESSGHAADRVLPAQRTATLVFDQSLAVALPTKDDPIGHL